MADSVLELVAEIASSTLFIFCFFNLIILIILFTSTPVLSSFDQKNDEDDDDRSLSIVIHSNTNTEQNFMPQKDATVDVWEVIETHNKRGRCRNCSDDVEQSDDDHEDEDEDEDEDDFKRRVEEFIEKVNTAWREERQRTSRSLDIDVIFRESVN